MEKEAEGMERYMIREAAKQVGVETHVLRYWEKELLLDIPKNDMGRRYYTSQEIALLRQIKYLKDQGFYLKSIRLLKDNVPKVAQMDMGRLHSLRDRLNGQLAEITAADGDGDSEDVTLESGRDEEENGDKDCNQTIFYAMKGISTGVPAGGTAGVLTGKVVGTKVMTAFTGEKAELDHQEEKTEGHENIKSQILELELVEPKLEEEHGKRQFNVVQGGKGQAVDTVFRQSNSVSMEKKKGEIQASDKQETEVSADADGRMEQFRMIMSDIIGQALKENNKELAKDVGGDVSEKVIKEMDFMMRSQQEEEEARYRKLDETIRSCQRSRQEAAVSGEGGKRKRRLFSLKK